MLIWAVYRQKFLLKDRFGKRGIEILNIGTQRHKLASGRQDPGAGDAAGIDGIAQLGIAVNTGVSKIAHRSETTLQVFASHCAPSNTRLLGDSAIASNCDGAKLPLQRRALSASGGDNHIDKQVRVAVDEPGQKRRACPDQ